MIRFCTGVGHHWPIPDRAFVSAAFSKAVFAIAAGFLFLLFSCNTGTKTVEGDKITKGKKSITVPSFSSDSAYYFIEKQLAFGPRVPNTPGHQLCGDYLVKKLESFGATVTVQNFTEEAFDGTVLRLRNIIASYNPQEKKRVLLAAHWDTRPFADKDTSHTRHPIMGANDGASGVAVLLEIARKLHHHELPKVGIDIIFFDGEDYGEPIGSDVPNMKDGRMRIWWCLGSQYWGRNPHKPKYSAFYGILLDMVGAKDARFFKEGGSMQFAPKVMNKVWTTARYLGYENYFVNTTSPGITDDHIFVNTLAKIPMINIVDHDPRSDSYYFPGYHHTHLDNLEIIDKLTLQAVGETVLYVIYNE